MVDWNKKTSSIADGLAQGTGRMIYVYALRIREVIPFSLEKKDHIYVSRMLALRQN